MVELRNTQTLVGNNLSRLKPDYSANAIALRLSNLSRLHTATQLKHVNQHLNPLQTYLVPKD